MYTLLASRKFEDLQSGKDILKQRNIDKWWVYLIGGVIFRDVWNFRQDMGNVR